MGRKIISPWSADDHLITVMLAFFVVFLPATHSEATQYHSNNLFFDSSRPQTPEEVKQSYYRYVSRRNGITKDEAKIIAQFEIVRRMQDDQYDIRRPKVIEESKEAWTVQIPEKFSLTSHSVESHCVIRVEKKSGKGNIVTAISEKSDRINQTFK